MTDRLQRLVQPQLGDVITVGGGERQRCRRGDWTLRSWRGSDRPGRAGGCEVRVSTVPAVFLSLGLMPQRCAWGVCGRAGAALHKRGGVEYMVAEPQVALLTWLGVGRG